MRKKIEEFTFLLSLTSLLIITTSSNSKDVIDTTHMITDGQTLISSDGSFELGFFSPGNSKNRYVGIWYKKITAFTVVWVANRDNPLTNTSGTVLKVIEPGILALLNGSNAVVWSSNTSLEAAQNPVAQLLDSGNLVVKEANDGNSDKYLWQSFDYPTDTHLPGMKLGWNFVTGHETYITAWKSSEDPGSGDYTYHVDPTGYPELVVRKGSVDVYRTGPWNGVGFSGLPGLKNNTIYRIDLVFDRTQVYYQFELLNKSVPSRILLNQNGVGQRWCWVDRTQSWVLYLSAPVDDCDSYKQCGAYGSCNIENSPKCGCLRNFIARDREEWAAADWTNGCVRRTALDCKTDGFLKYSDIKLPDTKNSWFNASMTLEECRVACVKDCNCTAYTNLDVRRGGSGCLLWFGDLVDIKVVNGAVQDLYIRMASSEVDSNGKKRKTLITVLTSLAGIILLALALALILSSWKRRNNHQNLKKEEGQGHEESHEEDLELPKFEFLTVAQATNGFSVSNKVGEGGFGPVYRGMLEDGKEIAVKRLSRTSQQGLDEFKNEVIFIAKLQHRNLVKLLGCCIQGQEKMLIYEYMPNGSLDLILFDKTKSKQLDWPKRFHIINGIARGLLYLHQDSRLRIIHRDLKASNILLDTDMNPKISDFGTARSFAGNETEANTMRVVGTYGYISPEYAVDGLFSVKSDIFSFGVLVLEIVSGQRNRGFHHKDHHHNLLGHAWILQKERRSLELVDTNLVGSFYLSEAVRSIHVALLCVQQSPEDRPSMSSVVLMLGSEGTLPPPKQPGFFAERDVGAAENTGSSKNTVSSSNEYTITLLDGR